MTDIIGNPKYNNGGIKLRGFINYIKENLFFILRTLNAMIFSSFIVSITIMNTIFELFETLTIFINNDKYNLIAVSLIIDVVCIIVAIAVDFMLSRISKRYFAKEVEYIEYSSDISCE